MCAAIDFYYHPLSVASRCAWMVLEELGLDYNEHVLDIFKGEHKTEDYRKINARLKVPAIRDGDLCIGERYFAQYSRAIAAYLASEYGATRNKQHLYPSDPKQRAVVDQHLYISENVWDQIIPYVNPGGVLFGAEFVQTEKIGEVKNALQLIESFLTKHAFMASDEFTLADIFYYSDVCALDLTDFTFHDYPKIAEWKRKISELPYHKKTWGDPAAEFRTMYQNKLKDNQALTE